MHDKNQHPFTPLHTNHKEIKMIKRTQENIYTQIKIKTKTINIVGYKKIIISIKETY